MALPRAFYGDQKRETAAPRGAASDFSSLPLFSPGAASMLAVEGQTAADWDRPGPISKTGDAGAAAPAPAAPAPAQAPPVAPAAPQGGVCGITTATLAAAPNGAANSRTTVGVGELVTMTSTVSAAWTASGGTLTPATGTAVTWTAPSVGPTYTITATPAGGTPCSVTMTVVAPNRFSLGTPTHLTYSAGLAGSGFTAPFTISPLDVSFSRVEIREETAVATASGYYDTVMHWNGVVHPQTAGWAPLNASNVGSVGPDTVGTPPPGSGGPFSPGTFLWSIPQSFRVVGSGGAGANFYTAVHAQVMTDTNGTEGTAKEGASRGRRP